MTAEGRLDECPATRDKGVEDFEGWGMGRHIESRTTLPRLTGGAPAFRRIVTALMLVIALSGLAPLAGTVRQARAQDAIALLPSAPGLAAPTDGATIEDAWGEVVLQWQETPGALEYQVLLNGGERTGPWVAGTSWSPGSLPEGIYTWAVRARNEAGAGEPGLSFTFTVMPAGEGAPIAAEPTGELAPLPFQLQQPAEVAEDAPGAELADKFLRYQMPVELEQQDATDATAGSTGQDGTVNGQPRENAGAAPAEATDPATAGNVMLPPPVPGLPTNGNINPDLAAGIGSTAELVFDAVADTTVFGAAPGAPQSPESINFLAIGGANQAVALMSFEVSGVGEGTVLGARLTFYGAGEAGAPGGSVGVIYDFVAWDGMTANGTPDGDSALNVHGAPAWFERVEPSGLTAIDVTGSVFGDGTLTFALPGQAEQTASIYAMESGSPPQLILTVALPA